MSVRLMVVTSYDASPADSPDDRRGRIMHTAFRSSRDRGINLPSPVGGRIRFGSAWRPVGRVMWQLGLILTAALAYFGVRGRTEGDEASAVAHGEWILRLERSFGLDFEAAVQSSILDRGWIVAAANWVYIWGHWPVIALTLIWLYRRHRESFLLLRNAMFISGLIGLVVFMAFPVAPPRLMPGPFSDTVTEFSNSYRVLQPPSLINKFAAMPSLHVGWNLLVALIAFSHIQNRVGRVLALASPVVMASAVVLTANHYVIDALAGSLVALVGLVAATALACRLAIYESNCACVQTTPARCRPLPELPALGAAA
jgi:PAP2 superfamily protein